MSAAAATSVEYLDVPGQLSHKTDRSSAQAWSQSRCHDIQGSLMILNTLNNALQHQRRRPRQSTPYGNQYAIEHSIERESPLILLHKLTVLQSERCVAPACAGPGNECSPTKYAPIADVGRWLVGRRQSSSAANGSMPVVEERQQVRRFRRCHLVGLLSLPIIIWAGTVGMSRVGAWSSPRLPVGEAPGEQPRRGTHHSDGAVDPHAIEKAASDFTNSRVLAKSFVDMLYRSLGIVSSAQRSVEAWWNQQNDAVVAIDEHVTIEASEVGAHRAIDSPDYNAFSSQAVDDAVEQLLTQEDSHLIEKIASPDLEDLDLAMMSHNIDTIVDSLSSINTPVDTLDEPSNVESLVEEMDGSAGDSYTLEPVEVEPDAEFSESEHVSTLQEAASPLRPSLVLPMCSADSPFDHNINFPTHTLPSPPSELRKEDEIHKYPINVDSSEYIEVEAMQESERQKEGHQPLPQVVHPEEEPLLDEALSLLAKWARRAGVKTLKSLGEGSKHVVKIIVENTQGKKGREERATDIGRKKNRA